MIDVYFYIMITTTILILLIHILLGGIELEDITGAVFTGIIWPVLMFLILGAIIFYIITKLETPSNLG